MNYLVIMMMIKYGADWTRQMLFDNIVQQRLSRSRDKMLTTLHANFELEGLIIDWHLADTDMEIGRAHV